MSISQKQRRANTLNNQFEKEFKSVLRAGVPLVCVQTPDPQSVISQIVKITESGKDFNFPIIAWDGAAGLKAWGNKDSLEVQAELVLLANQMANAEDQIKANMIVDPIGTFKLLENVRKRCIVVIHNGHRYLGSADERQAVIGQAIWNLRDKYKSSNRTLVILAPQIKLPSELKQDILVLDEPFPDKVEIEDKIKNIFAGTELSAPPQDVLDKASEAGKGLSLFALEQAVAMSISRKGLDLKSLWYRKRKQVEQTPGLSIYPGTETFDDIRGVESVKSYLNMLFNGRERPTVIVFMDEIEKMFAGIQGDLSGVSQEQHGEFLRWTQDQKILAQMMVGHPGCSKSFLAKCAAGQFEVPMVELNISALKAGIVGETGMQTREAFRTISAIGRPFIMASSNSLTVIPGELKRRFKQGIWFFDLPTVEERQKVWELYLKKFEIKDTAIPEDDGWTPDEIETCCMNAWRFRCSLKQGASFVTPINTSEADKILALRKAADNRFLSASYSGTYKLTQSSLPPDLASKLNLSKQGKMDA